MYNSGQFNQIGYNSYYLIWDLILGIINKIRTKQYINQNIKLDDYVTQKIKFDDYVSQRIKLKGQ